VSGYIDLHNHILPGIDDGPSELEESVQLARDLSACGFSTIVATPHSLGGKPSPDLIMQKLELLQEALEQEQVPLTILSGAEQHIEPELVERLERKEVLTLNQTSYLLLELPMFQPLPVYTEPLLFRLVSAGYRPVIPHPERVIALQMNQQMLFRLQQLGALYQVTWGAFTGLLGPAAAKTARYMLKAGLVHLLSTDVHHPGSSLLAVDKVAAVLDQKRGSNYSQLMLTERPGLILAGKPLDLPAPKYPERRPPKRVPFLSRLFRV